VIKCSKDLDSKLVSNKKKVVSVWQICTWMSHSRGASLSFNIAFDNNREQCFQRCGYFFHRESVWLGLCRRVLHRRRSINDGKKYWILRYPLKKISSHPHQTLHQSPGSFGFQRAFICVQWSVKQVVIKVV